MAAEASDRGGAAGKAKPAGNAASLACTRKRHRHDAVVFFPSRLHLHDDAARGREEGKAIALAYHTVLFGLACFRGHATLFENQEDQKQITKPVCV